MVLEAPTQFTAPRQFPFWCRVFVFVAALALIATVAGRTFHVTIPHGVTITANASHASRQHMDGDAAQLPVPVLRVVALQAPTFYPYVAPAGPHLHVLLLADSLYNRPPPAC